MSTLVLRVMSAESVLVRFNLSLVRMLSVLVRLVFSASYLTSRVFVQGRFAIFFVDGLESHGKLI